MTDSATDSNALRRERLSALERRLREEEDGGNGGGGGDSSHRRAHLHELRQSFRRLIDPGIVRPNNRENAMMALKTLVTLSDNLLREPGNTKYAQFKPTNDAIKQRLVNIKGAVEYAVAMGFHLKVVEMQPVYVFNGRRHAEDLRIGNEILHEVYEREMGKQERSQQSTLSEKELREIARKNVQMNFQEDRRAKQLKDDLELRRMREAAAMEAARPSVPEVASPTPEMPLGGRTLGGDVEPPPPPPSSSPPSESVLRARRSTSGDVDEDF